MTRALAEIELIARQREAWHELDRYLGGPTVEHHVRADMALDIIDNCAFWLGELERWHNWEAA